MKPDEIMRTALKNETRHSHTKVDDAFSTLNLADYLEYSIFLDAHFRAYSTLSQHHHDHPALSGVVKNLRDLIRADLSVLGADNALTIRHGTPPAPHPLGVGYVIGGSHFGKRVLQKRWSKSTDARVLNAGRYLDNALLKPVWQTILADLQTIQPDGQDGHAIIDSANTTFDLFFASIQTAKTAPAKRLEAEFTGTDS